MTGRKRLGPEDGGFCALRLACLLCSVQLLLGCAAISGVAASGFADGLGAAILDQDDPELVREATPAFLMLLDAMVRGDPENPRYLGAAAQLYAAYAVAFVDDATRAGTLASRSREYGLRAVCAAEPDACGLDSFEFERFANVIDQIGSRDAEELYSYCVSSLAFVRTHSSDWSAIAMLPKIEHALQHLLVASESPNSASVNMYLGILNTLRPPALGGQPERGRDYFVKAIELSGGRDLSAKVEFARGYARLVYDRELHDRLLNEVLQAEPRQEGLTLFNTLAQRQARQLLATADDYF